MSVIQQSFIFKAPASYFLERENGRKTFYVMARKRDFSENLSSQQQQPKPIFPLRVSNTILARSAVAVFGLGFIDAGYSGDWTRIGVIPKDAEDLLKVAAFVVVPLCIFLIFSFSKEPET
ncbi:hypothetical protein SLE2022_151660 [Rubroshorea leprosula]